MAHPRVSVLMSVYNGELYLTEAIDSVLGQTFTDFEYIIINDGSTDRTGRILRGYTDARIQVFEQTNMGLTRSLNRGISLARGEYVARMDADDVSMPERLAKQVDFLDAHPEVGVLGTACIFRDEVRGREWPPPIPISNEDIRRSFIRGNPLIHPTVMVRKSLLDAVGGYDEAYRFAQDYALWIKLTAYTQMANLPDVLVIHREHWQTVTMAHRSDWRAVLASTWIRMGLRYRAFRALDYPLSNILYVLHPIWLTLLERRPYVEGYLRKISGRG